MSMESLDDPSLKFSELVTFIENYSDDKPCEKTVFEEIKELFRAYLLQGQDFGETLADKQNTIEDLEDSIALYKSRFGDIDQEEDNLDLTKNSSLSRDELIDNVDRLNAEVDNLKLQHGEELEQLTIEHVEEIKKLNEEIDILQNTHDWEIQIQNLESENTKLKNAVDEM